ncbi:MAG: pyridoxamine 5'-phosphate oxidase family protein [Actinomycetota bacterium]|nr:pyridoxamine 5'-phosphate oxidase family protein [Actinomycetota bacterium]
MTRLDLSLTEEELEEFLATEKTVRIATAAEDGTPHVIPLWFVWLDGAMYLNSTFGNVTVENIQRTGKASAVVDDGETYDSLRGVVVTGTVELIGVDDPGLEDLERAWSEKLLSGNDPPYRRWKRRTWMRLQPERIASWDFRKIPDAIAERDAARRT